MPEEEVSPRKDFGDGRVEEGERFGVGLHV